MAVEHWIWYQLAVGAGCNRTGEMLSFFGGAEQLYNSSNIEKKLSGIFTAKQLEKLEKTPLDEAYAVLEKCREYDCKIVTPEDPLYPRMLKPLDDLPAVIYYQGDLRFLVHKVAVAIVGTREAGENSLAVAKSLSASITRSGAVVISGGALGVDSAAHLGAIQAGGKTVAVLGCGFGADYLLSNEELRQKVAQNGALISEYPPNTPAFNRNFPVRNRIISGLSHGTVVVEAGLKSGSLLTANTAVQQGRDIYAVPGNLMSSKFLGVNKLINEGAKAVFSAYDVLYSYALKYPRALDIEKIERELVITDSIDDIKTKGTVKGRQVVKVPKSKNKDAKVVQERKEIDFTQYDFLSPDAKSVLSVFNGEAIHIDDIARQTGLSISKIFGVLTELEMSDIIVSQPGKLYNLK